MQRRSTPLVLKQVAVLLAVLVLWELFARSGLAAEAAFPPISMVLIELVESLTTASFWGAVGQTLGGALQGFIIAGAIGVPLGVIIGSSSFLERSSQIIVDFGRSFPAIALLPIFVLLYGTSGTTRAIVVAIGCVFPIIVQSLYGARSVDPAVVEAARAYRIPGYLQLLRVILPSAVPSIMTGLRLGATMAVLLAIGVEILGGIPGLGQRIAAAQQDGATALAFAFILVASFLGFMVSKSSQLLEQRLLAWRPPSTVS